MRCALSSLSSRDTADESTRSLCTRIVAFQWKDFALAVNADKRMRETYGSFLAQFEMLQLALRKEWSPAEVSSILIRLNAHARALSAMVKQIRSTQFEGLSYRGKI